APHNHLGETWSSPSASLVITRPSNGSFTAPLIVGNSSAGSSALLLDHTGGIGIDVDHPALSGVEVLAAGGYGVIAYTSDANHFGGYFFNGSSGPGLH